MFQLLRLNQDPVSHSVSVMIEYEWKNDTTQRIEKDFKDRETAVSWINQERKKYGWTKLNAFIQHKKILSECSHQWSTPEDRFEKLHSLEICLREVEVIKDSSLLSLAEFIQILHSHLVKILPLEHHLTYTSQRRIINDLWTFSQEVIKPR